MSGVLGPDAQTILYIEDNVVNAILMRRIFEKAMAGKPVRLVVAETGKAGAQLAEELRPAVILLDLHLPDMSGKDVLRGLRASAELRLIPVIVVTADAAPATIAEVRFLGAHSVITKPVEIADVVQRLKRLLPALGEGAA